MEPATVSVRWHPEARLLKTRVSGVLSADDVQAWKARLDEAGARIPPAQPFRMLIDIRGYQVADQARDVHQVMREVTPLFLAAHGFTVGFFSLYDEAPPLARNDVARCGAVAHVHHDVAKMDRYNELLATPHERFFTDAEEAEAWLLAVTHAPEAIANI